MRWGWISKTRSYDHARCVVMQGGQGEVKHWAFNDPLKRKGKFKNQPPSPAEYRKLSARVVDLHPMTIIQCFDRFEIGSKKACHVHA